MKKYLAIDETIGGDGTIDVYAFDTLEEANNEAEFLWRHLTHSEQKKRRVCVGLVTEADLYDDAVNEDGNVDWCAYHSYRCEDGFFNSDKLMADEDQEEE